MFISCPINLYSFHRLQPLGTPVTREWASGQSGYQAAFPWGVPTLDGAPLESQKAYSGVRLEGHQ